MDRLKIACASCGQEWVTAVPFSVYEQQAVESCPCPHCGAYTLCCGQPAATALRSRRLAVSRPVIAH